MSGFSFTRPQQQALDLEKGKLVLAGAGSGKTTVLVERYLRLLEQRRLFPDQIVAVTFTKKAAAQLKAKVYQNLLQRERTGEQGLDFYRQRRERMPWARISTIHSFCARLLRAYPFQAGVDPGFSVEERSVADRLETVREHVRRLGYSRDEYLKILLDAAGKRSDVEELVNLVLGRRGLQEALQRLLDDPAAMQDALDEGLRRMIADWRIPFPDKVTEDTVAATHEGYVQRLTALAKVALPLVKQGGAPEAVLPHDDLEQLALRLLLAHPRVASRIRRSIRALLIDEFQDTSSTQWAIFRELAKDDSGAFDPDRLFIVGDEKQSIYGFREADVTVVHRALEAMCGHTKRSEALKSGRFVDLNDNFRTVPRLVDTLNPVFERLLQSPHGEPMPFEAQPQRLTPGREVSGGEDAALCELMLGRDIRNEELYRSLARRLRAEIGTLRIHGEDGLRPLEEDDIVILLRTRGKLSLIAEALREAGLNVRTEGETGFTTRQEVLDLLNLLGALSDGRDALAWTGAWRGPFFSFSDTLVSLLHLTGETPRRAWKQLAEGEPPADWPPDCLSREDRNSLQEGLELWRELERRAHRIEPAELLRYALIRTGALTAYASGDDGEQRVANIYKLLDLIGDLNGHTALSLRRVHQKLSEHLSEESEEFRTQADLTTGSGVRIMTYHKAKGLEFPYVVLADLSGKGRSGGNKDGGDLLFPEGPARELALPALNALAEPDFTDEAGLEKPLHWWMQTVFSPAQAAAEEKRLMYVAATRAKDRLLLVSHVKFKNDGTLHGGQGPMLQAWFNAFGIRAEDDSISEPEFDAVDLTVLTSEDVADKPAEMHSKPDPVDTALEQPWTLPATPVEDPEVRLAPAPVRERITLSITAFGHYLAAPGEASARALFERQRQENDAENGDSSAQPDTAFVPELAADIGTLVHRLYQRFGPGCAWSEAEKEAARTVQFWLLGDTEEARVLAILRAHLEHGRAMGLHTLPDGASREARVSFDLGPLHLHGKADLAWRDDAAVHVLDYKTNHWAETQLDERIRTHGYDHQARLYAVAFRQAWRCDRAEAELAFLYQGIKRIYDVDETVETGYRKIAEELMLHYRKAVLKLAAG